MKIVSFNTNDIRVREHQLSRLKAEYDPDIIGIQESKVQDADFPVNMIDTIWLHGSVLWSKDPLWGGPTL
ncbi:MAG: hypothetical protein KZQ60_10340 [Candidatus Thiodiazotropha sp. (ex Lucinoma aequizonata)]|nr:hypothetical protein [Candidatus Thiodiazotropha sp. (ex Lucinoma aequizonata)]MCU7889494.1 hypothetical protein [Candidatus Thiodiazotropha sp. (ex Lucinoma aequizonata)]MCU7909509.1 hypothetical protein [Candidatus Thiodiazotropha sp. (ex Lucinoma aequizonata)]MCU7913895.1 hypothetical protein [Candidatus Thiodiazotropha sp. (ex Lucinoma aequizonata)]